VTQGGLLVVDCRSHQPYKETAMASEPRVTKETVEKLAREVVGLDLSPDEIDQLTPQLDKLLADLAQIPDADLQDVEPPLFFQAGEPEHREFSS
jgi:hypothetical protein